MRSNIIVKEYVMCDMRVCVRMNALYIQDIQNVRDLPPSMI